MGDYLDQDHELITFPLVHRLLDHEEYDVSMYQEKKQKILLLMKKNHLQAKQIFLQDWQVVEIDRHDFYNTPPSLQESYARVKHDFHSQQGVLLKFSPTTNE
eukprot:CAMPEP_0117017810 /NCGR_PEP_ID=MMETSP0472-20121206/13858_1 /TAXON_ID=693140 ORGANISM="Tiarina fusus, Strain LIS" /NCGR_SAMPLE_ID=MMETSP0472 /ASSEMBLY_ACC=CAM_ASM_000603 /LENGTH=101 /DNA_ID=CAMNT_0004722287 /DNA_START=91 /DNA_END=396 /DNA_ORIENTATION=+